MLLSTSPIKSTPVPIPAVFPDLGSWGNKYALVAFDADPTAEVPSLLALPEALRLRAATMCMMRGFTWATEKFMAYLMPGAVEETLRENPTG